MQKNTSISCITKYMIYSGSRYLKQSKKCQTTRVQMSWLWQTEYLTLALYISSDRLHSSCCRYSLIKMYCSFFSHFFCPLLGAVWCFPVVQWKLIVVNLSWTERESGMPCSGQRPRLRAQPTTMLKIWFAYLISLLFPCPSFHAADLDTRGCCESLWRVTSWLASFLPQNERDAAHM